MKRLVLTVAVSAVVVSLAITHAAVSTGQTRNNRRQKQIAVKALNSPRMPANIRLATATDVDERTVLSYLVTNRGDGDLASLQVVAFVINPAGAIVGGEGWTLDTDLAKGSTETFSAILKNRVASDGKVAVGVWKAAGQFGAVEIEHSELLEMVK